MDHSDMLEKVAMDFEVESILKKGRKGAGGKKYFLVKWMHYDESHNSWVHENDIGNKRLIADFESRRVYSMKLDDLHTKEMIRKRKEYCKLIRDMNIQIEKVTIPEKADNPFNYGLQPSHITYVEKKGNEFIYTVKWKHGKISKVSSAVICQECPQLAIDFYSNIPIEELEDNDKKTVSYADK